MKLLQIQQHTKNRQRNVTSRLEMMLVMIIIFRIRQSIKKGGK